MGSNLVQLTATFVSGTALYGLFQRHHRFLNVLAYLVSGGILLSFLFNIGEIYSYSAYYKRAFFVFGDDITTILALFFCYAVLSQNRLLLAFTGSSIVMSGGKISLILLLMSLAIILFLRKEDRRSLLKLSAQYLGMAVLIYGASLIVSDVIERTGLAQYARIAYSSVESAVDKHVDLGGGAGDGNVTSGTNLYGDRHRDGLAATRGQGACSSLARCFESQIKAAVLQRYYSSLGGLWMTLQGGFRGERYPSNAAEFADLMVRANPWHINDRYGLTWLDWWKMGAPQNPYLRFGSGYGPWLLALAILGFAAIAVLAFMNLRRASSGPLLALSVFYLVNVTLNQTQSWLTSGSLVLAALGFCTAHVVREWKYEWCWLRRERSVAG